MRPAPFPLLSLLILSIVSLSWGSNLTLEDVFERCKGKLRPEIEPCVIQVTNQMRSLLEEGIPELELPSLLTFPGEDFLVDEKGGPNSYITARFYEVVVKGLNEVQLKELRLDYPKGLSHWTVQIPQYLLSGRYEMDAQILYVPLKGKGTFWFKVVDVVLKGSTAFVLDGPLSEDKSRLSIRDTHLDFTFANVSAKLNNLYQGDPILEQAADVFLSENTVQIVEEVKPSVIKNLEQNAGTILSKVFDQIPLNNLAGSQFLVGS